MRQVEGVVATGTLSITGVLQPVIQKAIPNWYTW